MDGMDLIEEQYQEYTKEIKKLNNVFFTRIICVFWKTAPKEDKNSQKIDRNIIPMI